jgi:hypothetical protein
MMRSIVSDRSDVALVIARDLWRAAVASDEHQEPQTTRDQRDCP